MISVAPIDNTSLVCDPSWVSNALEQAERLTSDTRAKKVLHNFAWNLLYNKVLHTFAWNPLYNTFVPRHRPSLFTLTNKLIGFKCNEHSQEIFHPAITCRVTPKMVIFTPI